MTTFFIVIAYILIAYLFLAFIAYYSELSNRLDKHEARLDVLKKTINGNAKRGNEHLRAFRELASLLGYCVDEEHEVRFTMDSIFGDKDPEHIKRLVVHKKGLVAKPAKKLVVNKKKTK